MGWRETQKLNDPVYAEIQKIYFDQEKGFKSASSFFTSSDLATIRLTPGEHQALIKISGQELYNFINSAMEVEEWNNMSPAIKRNIINNVKEKYITTYRTMMFTGHLAIPAAEMKTKELTGDFKTPEDRKDFLKKMRKNQESGTRAIGPLRPDSDYKALLDSLNSFYNP